MTRSLIVVSSLHPLGLPGSPGREQLLPGHCDAVVHAAPEFVPPRHRVPLQMGPIGPAGSGQSALTKHDVLLPLLHVPHMHLLPPEPVQFGLAVVNVLTTELVALLRLIPRTAIWVPGDDVQSRLVVPKSGRLGTWPLPSHAKPARGPTSHVPPSTPSLIAPSPMQREQGWSIEDARKTELLSSAVFTASPDSMFAVPVISPLKTFETHVLTPPAASGRLEPK